MGASDAELVRQCLRGDNTGFDLLVRKYQRQVHAFCYRMLGNAEDSADAAQESFVKAYHALESFRLDAQFLSWIFRIASNTCIDRSRAKARRPSVALEDLGDERDVIPSTDPSPEEALLRGECNETIREAVLGLSEKQRPALVMFYYHGMTIREIAQALQKPEGTVKSDLHSAREKLRRKLEGVMAEI